MKNNIYDTLLNLYDDLDEETKKDLIIYKSSLFNYYNRNSCLNQECFTLLMKFLPFPIKMILHLVKYYPKSKTKRNLYTNIENIKK